MPRSSVPRSWVIGLLTVALASAGLLSAGPASAAAVPYAPKYHAGIDAYSSYETENTCSIKPKPGVVAWRDLLIRTYGSRWNNISRACSASVSGHEEGRSLDYGNLASNPTQKAQADALLGWLLATDVHGNTHAMARRLGIQYIQYNNKMWRAYNPSAGWQPQMMGGKDCAKLGAGSVTSCHRDHIHFSFAWAGANKKTSYFTGSVPCATPPDVPAFTEPMPTDLVAVPIEPFRLLDTRVAPDACRLAPRGHLDLQVTGVGGVPWTDVGAVVLNVTGVRPTGGGTYLSAFPAGTQWTGTSSVNVPKNGNAASLVTVPVGSDGMVSIRNGSAPVDVVVDVVGYFTHDVDGSPYTPVDAQRVLDTRQSEIMPSGGRLTVPITGSYGVPAEAQGVLVNVTSTGATGAGYVTVAPSIGEAPTTSTVNFGVRDTVANRALTRLSPDGALEIYARTSTHVVIDIVGWFGPGGEGLHYSALAPARILDTRTGNGDLGPLQGQAVSVLAVGGRGGVPLDARSVMATFTVTGPTNSSHATAWPDAQAQPGTSDLNFPRGATRANLIAPQLSAESGAAALTINAGSANAIVDVLGYFR